MIQSANPLGWSCSFLCATSELCEGNCNLTDRQGGAIKIAALQQFAMRRYAMMKVQPTSAPLPVAVEEEQKVECATSNSLLHPTAPISLVGAGPASLSCATILSRLGYRNIHIYERADEEAVQGTEIKEGENKFGAGGLSASEIPQFRVINTHGLTHERELEKTMSPFG